MCCCLQAITNGETPLNVLQLLWVNLIMDSLAALGGWGSALAGGRAGQLGRGSGSCSLFCV